MTARRWRALAAVLLAGALVVSSTAAVSWSTTSGEWTLIDSFEDNNLNEYTEWNEDTGQAQVADGVSWAYDGDAIVYFGNGQSNPGAVSTSGLPAYPEAGDAFRFRFQFNNSEATRFYFGVPSETADPDGFVIINQRWESRFELGVREGGQLTVLDNESVSYEMDASSREEWYTVTVYWGADGQIEAVLEDPSGSEVATLRATNETYTEGGIGMRGKTQGSDDYVYYDYLQVNPDGATGYFADSSGVSQTLTYQDSLASDGVDWHSDDTVFTVSRQDTGQLQQSSDEWVEVESKTENWEGQATFGGLSNDEVYRATLTLEHSNVWWDEVGWSPDEKPEPWIIDIGATGSPTASPTGTGSPIASSTATATATPEETITANSDGTVYTSDPDGVTEVRYVFRGPNETTYEYNRSFDDPPEWYGGNWSGNGTGIEDPSEWELNYSVQDGSGEWFNGTTGFDGTTTVDGSGTIGGPIGPIADGGTDGPSPAPLTIAGIGLAGVGAFYLRKPQRRQAVVEAARSVVGRRGGG